MVRLPDFNSCWQDSERKGFELSGREICADCHGNEISNLSNLLAQVTDDARICAIVLIEVARNLECSIKGTLRARHHFECSDSPHYGIQSTALATEPLRQGPPLLSGLGLP